MKNNPARYFPMAEQDKDNPVPVCQWCLRHRFNVCTEDCSESQDNYSVIAEQCITSVRNPFFWPRLKAHIQAYAGTEIGLKLDPIHKEVRKGMKLRMDRCQCGPPKGRMMIEKDSEAPSYCDGLVSRMTATKKGKKKSIFTHTMFSFTKDDFSNRFSNFSELENKQTKQRKVSPDYLKKKQIYSQTILVGGFEAKNTQENLDFLLGKNTLIEDNNTLNEKKEDSLLN